MNVCNQKTNRVRKINSSIRFPSDFWLLCRLDTSRYHPNMNLMEGKHYHTNKLTL